LLLFLLGLLSTIIAFIVWGQHGFGDIDPSDMMRITIPALVGIIVGAEGMFAGFFIGILRLAESKQIK
jgi:hypothetical protein